jgi:hypothetical protein
LFSKVYPNIVFIFHYLEWNEKYNNELKSLNDEKKNILLLKEDLDEKNLMLKRDESNLILLKNELESKRKLTMTNMENEMIKNREERNTLERVRLELNIEKTSLDVDKKNMKIDMDRLTELGMELRKQSQSLSEAQVCIFFPLFFSIF